MLNVSNAFKQLLYEGKRNYLSYADITLSDGTKLTLDNSDIWDSGMEISDSVSSDNSFDVGAAIVNSSKIVINNIYDDYSDYDFSNAEVIMYVGLKLPDGTTERVRKGTFHVDEPKYNGAIITLNCLDNMSKFDRPYSESTLQYPANLNQIVRDACSKCGVTLQTYDFPHDDYVVQERPEDEATTFGEVVQWAAQIACCFCRCDVYGRLELKWYNQEAFENRYFLSGGTFKNIPPTNDTMSGGAFNPWTDGELINSGGFTDLDGIHHIYSLGSISTSTDDVVITGVSVSVKASDDDSGQEIVVSETGASGYVISIENNNLINVGDGATVAGWIGEKLIGFRFRKASVSHLSDPTIEAGDVAILTDIKGRNYNIIISSTKFNSNGSYQNTESSALDPARNSATRFSESTKNYVEYRKEIKREKTRREQAIEELTNRINNSSGTFTTIETQADGSHIYYLHNKPTLADSDIIWKMTAEAWGVSTDGGKTYNAGMTVDGDTIVRILTATGVNADWINTGAIQVTDDDGSIIFSVDMDTRQVIISGDHVRIGGKTATAAIDEALEEARKARNLNMILDNEYQGIYTDHNGNIATFPNVKTTVQVLYGHTDVSANCSYTTNKSSGVTGTWNNASRTYTVTGLSTDTGWVDITASYLSLFVVTKRFNIEKIKGGTNGSNGVSVTGTTITYQASSSGTSIPTGNWSSSIPTVSAGQYLWTRTQFNYSNGNHTYSYSVSRMGQNGTDGNDGKGIKSSNTTYQASTSGTSVPTGNWSSSIPTVSAGQYLWTRTIFQYTDGTTSTSYSVGKMGQNGTPGRTYMIEPSVNILKRSHDNTISPNFVEFRAYYRDGNSATRTAYNGRWIIEETSDGDTWTTIYTSSANENSVTHYVYSLLADSDGSAIANANGDTIGIPRDVVAIRAKLYAAGGTTNLLDMQSVAVVIDVDNLTHEEIFNLLTNNGAVKGIYQEGDQLYISFTYAKGGELVLGGANNGNGIFILRNKSGAEIARMDNSGFSTTNGNFSGTITGSKISGSELDTNSASGSIGINVNAGEFAFFSQGQKVANISSMLMLTGSDGVTRRGVAVRQESDSNFISFGALGIDIIPSQEYPIQMKASTSVGGKLYAYFGAEIAGYLEVNGTKNRVINTKNYGKRLQYSYEMASPLFGDIGEGIINEKGECIVCIDDIFQETAKTSIEYQVFLQKEGEGDIWVEEKNEQYFTVKGTPDLKFAWEIKARQKDYESERLCVSHSDSSDGIIERQDYEYSGINRYFELTQEYLENSFFDAQKYISEMEDMFI